jgi:ribosomal protein L6P/L9E
LRVRKSVNDRSIVRKLRARYREPESICQRTRQGGQEAARDVGYVTSSSLYSPMSLPKNLHIFHLGTTRAYLQNHILGVSEGHTAILRLVGVGYRATIETTVTTVTPEFPGQTFVALKVGYSHPIELPVPKGVKASTPQPTRILLEGVEKEVILSFAAKIRMWRKPEPYKGKGIFVNGETIKLKAKKIK